MARKIEQRQVIPSIGMATEWEPDDDRSRQATGMDDAEVAAFVRRLNKAEKAAGSKIRYRSVDSDW